MFMLQKIQKNWVEINNSMHVKRPTAIVKLNLKLHC